MSVRCTVCSIVAAVTITSFTASAAAADALGTCPNDSKLLNGGPTKIFGEGPGTWWSLVVNGLRFAGFEHEDEQIAYLNEIFDTDF